MNQAIPDVQQVARACSHHAAVDEEIEMDQTELVDMEREAAFALDVNHASSRCEHLEEVGRPRIKGRIGDDVFGHGGLA
jgi:hypothetical protein